MGERELTALPFAAVIPCAVTVFANLGARRALKQTDSVSIIECGGQFEAKTPLNHGMLRAGKGAYRPLSASVFLKRHLSQTLLAAAVMTFLTVATALVIFVFSVGTDALQPALNNFSRISALAPVSGPLNNDMIKRIADNPDVEHVIPLYDFSPLKISIPPMFPDRSVQTLCVSREGMNYLVELYALQLAEGHLPLPGTNEIVLPWTVAKNRNIRVGDVIGDPERPAYPGASALPVKLVVSGIFAPAAIPEKETWLSFMSLEFVQPLKIGEQSLIVMPVAGKKVAVDNWLRKNVDVKETFVYTYKNQAKAMAREMGTMLFTFSLLECIIAVIAVVILAGLFYARFFARKTEFGVLLALGQGRVEITKRATEQAAIISVLAWITGMLICFAFLRILQSVIFEPVGLALDYLNPVPWLFTFPVPIAAVVAGGGAASKILSPLDPVAIIERR